MNKQKQCFTCKEYKPLSDFYKNKNSKDGLMIRCKKCHNNIVQKNYNKLLRQFHPEMFDEKGNLK